MIFRMRHNPVLLANANCTGLCRFFNPDQIRKRSAADRFFAVERFLSIENYFSPPSLKDAHSVPSLSVGLLLQQPTLMLSKEQQLWGEL